MSTPRVPDAPRKREGSPLPADRLEKIPKLVFPEDEKETEDESEKEGEFENDDDDDESLDDETVVGMLDLMLVRPKFLQYSKEGVLKMNDIDYLHRIRRWYSPQSQPRNWYEWHYITEVRKAAEERLRRLHCLCSSCEVLWEHISDEELFDYLE